MGEENKEEKARGFSKEQYDMLLRCSEKKDMTEWNEWRKKNRRQEILLKGADLCEAELQGANLDDANLQDAKLYRANLQGASLEEVNLQGACLEEANLRGSDLGIAHLKDADLCEADLEYAYLEGAYLEGTDFSESNLQDALFTNATVDGNTVFWRCKINRYTDFRGVSLDTVRIASGRKQLLEYNIRRWNWEDWYEGHRIMQWPVRAFWLMSDYGLSTWRVIGTFFVLALGFAAIYLNLACWNGTGIVSNLLVEPHEPLWHWRLLLVVRPVYFSIVTMTTLGFGDLYANANSVWGHTLLTFQVILGYVLLGALVTRFAVLFTAGGPAGRFADEPTFRQRIFGDKSFGQWFFGEEADKKAKSEV